MYNKLFTKILDSSIWLESHPTRLVWITLLAAMDQDGYAHFSAVENLAGRARVSTEECEKAIACFLAPDPNSGDPAHEGRRVERIPGGFLILNAVKYRETFKRAIQREHTRLRVEKHRAKSVTHGNARVTRGNAGGSSVTQSQAVAVATSLTTLSANGADDSEFEKFYSLYPNQKARGAAERAFRTALKAAPLETILAGVKRYAAAVEGKDPQYIKHPATWLNGKCWADIDPKAELDAKRRAADKARDALAEKQLLDIEYRGIPT